MFVNENQYSSYTIKKEVKSIPRPHQIKAIKDVLNGFKRQDRGKLIMACRTGKTPTSMFISESLFNKGEGRVVLFVAPSLLLLKQTKDDFLKLSNIDFKFGIVCSDGTVSKSDDLDISEEELGYRGLGVAKDINDIRKILRTTGRVFVFSTYQSLPKISKALKSKEFSNFSFDIGFADEAHRTASNKKSIFSTFHSNSNIKIKKRLYMTATPRVHSTKTNELAERLTYCMDNEKIFGKEFHVLSFKNAIKNNIIRDFEIHISTLSPSSKNLSKVLNSSIGIKLKNKLIDGDIISFVEATEKAIEKYNIRKVFVFFSRNKRAKNFVDAYNTLYPNRNIASVSSEDSSKIRSQKMFDFKFGKTQIIANARLLCEGITCGEGDMVVLCDGKNSRVDIAQAVSRVLNKSNETNTGHILLPVNLEKGCDYEANLKNGRFDAIIRTLRTMQDIDESLNDEILKCIENIKSNENESIDSKKKILIEYNSDELEKMTIENLSRVLARSANYKYSKKSVERSLLKNKYKNLRAWRIHNRLEHDWSMKQDKKWLENIIEKYIKTKQLQNKTRSREEVEENLKLKGYSNLASWEKDNKNEYEWCLKQCRSWRNDLVSRYIKNTRTFINHTKKSVEDNLAKKNYLNLKAWQKDNRGEYDWSLKQCPIWREKIISKLIQKTIKQVKRTKESVERSLQVKNYSSLTEWRRDNNAEYGWALKQCPKWRCKVIQKYIIQPIEKREKL